ncbi:DMT family transporter [Rhizobium sp. TRM96647]|uniref:DMT family transporter n=1 Tax=unclassified Rhizobium TaxID=2613769 RepID=UPI0021E7F7F1|nr:MULTISPECIES: DMT family transporter [unclassified Rhizobium]MCV3738192.1 DMT family transporter [Rhizobium sp. TRM96647]MCV3760059.1 DMT family transporter [Rhizobium sp. TRM96650]
MSYLQDPALHRKGLLITAIGGLALSFDIPLIRSAQGEVWSVLAVRSLATCTVAFVVWSIVRLLLRRPLTLVPGRAGILAGALYGIGSMTFMLAVFNTTTANVVFILAFTSMFAALLSWIFLGERPANATLLAMAAMVCGVALIVQDGLVSGNLFGDVMAALNAFVLASAITVSRKSGADMGFVPLVAAVIPAAVALTMLPGGTFQIEQPGFILFNGLVMIPLAFWCLATGPRYLSAPEVGMFYLLETILAPIWVWIIFTERPSGQTLVGGSILIAALFAHSLWQMRSKARAARHLKGCPEVAATQA